MTQFYEVFFKYKSKYVLIIRRYVPEHKKSANYTRKIKRSTVSFIIFAKVKSQNQVQLKYKIMPIQGLFRPYTFENIHPGFSIDCVIFSFYKKKIRVLLNKFDFSNYWQLPGGFMLKIESAEEAASRILASRTGLKNVFLKQFHLFSDPQRTKMEQNIEYIKQSADKEECIEDKIIYIEDTKKWFLQRFISLGYYAFVRYDEVIPTSIKEDTVKWFDINNLPKLYSDHENIINTSLETIRSMLSIIPIGYELLPEKFTMSELRKIYETILGKTLDRRNFQRKVLSTGIITQLDEVRNTSSYNPPMLYSFNLI